MTESFLIAHVVRGQPAFDIAEQMECTVCQGASCDECDEGHWWIIPTSGHRAHPFYSVKLNQCVDIFYMDGDINKPMVAPSSWPDHYAINNHTLRSEPSSSLADRLGLNLRQPSAPIWRRV